MPPAILFAAAIGAAILGQYDLAAWCAAAFILSLAALAIGA